MRISALLFLCNLICTGNAWALDPKTCHKELEQALEPMKECIGDADCELVWVGCPLCFEAVNRTAVKEVEQLRPSYAKCLNSFRCKCVKEESLAVKCEAKRCKTEFIRR